MITDEGLSEIADAIVKLADAIDRLGHNRAATPMGASEAFGDHIGKKMDDLVCALSNRDA